ncbi:RING finger protein unkempt [Cimex lectularius]|uniref:RING finger protein unkempt n=1 Tax=Cimex lectularius TaxID=79782 RepID=A0A8I6R9Q3_CIMLE|nr:RING finger protein unkempt [Cimex lectularius]
MRNIKMQVDKMPSESKPLLTAQTEKPNHYSYLKEFRVDQCSLFLQHKCTQHRPFTCFHWHFMNQRRRRPIRKRDGSFNYSADNYCTKYDETSGICPDGDECQFLHRTAGDTERRYHLRYYKTCMCVHDTDNRGFCVKNGAHCAFAHGNHDLRPPVYDIKEMQALDSPDGESAPNGPNVLDKERNLMNEDPKWQDTNYVLSSYKTEQCKRPPRLCRQGYACPQYHNSRDKRRSPRKYKYRSTPCPNVKHGDEWGEPSNCENGDNCTYCHTRTEQQFHPEIYKSTKCNDVQTAGYCPRGVFCAFAHIDQEMCLARDLAAPLELGTNLADILSNAMSSRKRTKESSESSNGSGELSECASTSSIGSNGSHSRAPGAQLIHRNDKNHINLFNHAPQNDIQVQDILNEKLTLDNSVVMNENDKSDKQNLFMALNIPQQHNNSILSSLHFDPSDILGNPLEDLHVDEPLGFVGMDRDFETDSPTISNSITAGLASSGMLGTSAPVNIPRSDQNSGYGSISPTKRSPFHHLKSGYFSASRFSHPDTLETSLLNHVGSNHLTSSTTKFGSLTNGSLYDYGISPNSRNPLGTSPLVGGAFSVVSGNRSITCDDKTNHARGSCEIWQKEAEEANRKALIAEQQRDEAMSQAKALQKEVDLLQGSPYLHGLRRVSELKSLPLTTLKSIQAQLKGDLEQVDKEVFLQTGTKCMVCEERNRTVTLGPCNHYVLCSTCAPNQKDCPYCQTPIIAHSTPTTTALHA